MTSQPVPRPARPHHAPARTPGRWILDANCRDMPEFPDLPAEQARPICKGCPVTRQCHLQGLAEALEYPDLDRSDAQHVYAGQTLDELISSTTKPHPTSPPRNNRPDLPPSETEEDTPWRNRNTATSTSSNAPPGHPSSPPD